MVATASEDARMKRTTRDFRSDTVTAPTNKMFEIMAQASRGDDEDETTNAFQNYIATLSGKADALYAVSGTMTNQLALRTHLVQPPHSVLCDARAHIYRYEAGGIAFHSQANTIAIQPKNGHHLSLDDDIIPNLVMDDDDIHGTPTKVISLENSLSGLVFPQDEIIRISKYAHELGIKMHCDGARIWEVAAKTGMSLDELCAPFDTVSLCLSKGISAPIGSVLVGPVDHIKKARWFRKLFGGGIRQCGSLTAVARYCLDEHFHMLPRGHLLARRLAVGFVPNVLVQIGRLIESIDKFIDTKPLGFDLETLSRRALNYESGSIQIGGSRLVVHLQTSTTAVNDLIALVATLKAEHQISPSTNGHPDWFKESEAFAQGKLLDHIPEITRKMVKSAYGR